MIRCPEISKVFSLLLILIFISINNFAQKVPTGTYIGYEIYPSYKLNTSNSSFYNLIAKDNKEEWFYQVKLDVNDSVIKIIKIQACFKNSKLNFIDSSGPIYTYKSQNKKIGEFIYFHIITCENCPKWNSDAVPKYADFFLKFEVSKTGLKVYEGNEYIIIMNKN